MPFELRMRPSPAPSEAPQFSSNDEIYKAWAEAESTRLQPVTHQHYGYEVKFFLDAWPDTLATTLVPRDVRAYMREYDKRCQHFRRESFRIGEGDTCVKKQDLATCGKNLCPLYNPILFQTAEKHLQALVSLYDFLVSVDAIPHNFIRDVKKKWVKDNRHRLRIRPKRLLTLKEVRMLVFRTAAPNRRVLYALLAKGGLRIKEALLLRVDAEHMNLAEGWLKIPEFPGKRRGSRIVIVDEELKPILQDYLKWREVRLTCNDDGAPPHDVLVVSHRGLPFDPDDETIILQKVVRPDSVRLGLEKVDGPSTHRVTPHRFRHFFSDTTKKNKIDPYWWNILRGDIPPGNEKDYVHPAPHEIRAIYLEFAPRIGGP